MVSFSTVVVHSGNDVGIEVPEEVVVGFGAGKRVPVTVTLNGHTCASTVAWMGGRYLVSVSRRVRPAAGVSGGEEHQVTLEHDTSSQAPDVPVGLAVALEAAGVRSSFDALPPSRSQEHVRSVTAAKTPDTRSCRVHKIVDSFSH